MENKKAQGLSITTLILIIIGVIILVVLIFGFTAGWDNIKNWLAPSSNVDQVVSQCSAACASNMKFDWCTKPRTLRVTEGGALATEAFGGDANNPAYDMKPNTKGTEVIAACKDFTVAPSYRDKFGIEPCPAIDC